MRPKKIKQPLPGFSPEHGLSSHRLVNTEVGEGIAHRRHPSIKPLFAVSVAVMALVAFYLS
jgi:hypothetical protein